MNNLIPVGRETTLFDGKEHGASHGLIPMNDNPFNYRTVTVTVNGLHHNGQTHVFTREVETAGLNPRDRVLIGGYSRGTDYFNVWSDFNVERMNIIVSFPTEYWVSSFIVSVVGKI